MVQGMRAHAFRSQKAEFWGHACLLGALVATIALAAAGSASAAPLYWSGTGTWNDGATSDWGTSSAGPYTTSTWVGGSDAVFVGSAGTVNVLGSPPLISSVNSMSFNTGGYTLTSSGGSINLTGTSGAITTASGNTLINLVLAGTNGLTKSGSGTLQLAGTNVYTGTTTVNAGTLDYSASGGMTKPAVGLLAMNGGTLAIDDGVTLTPSGTMTFTGNNLIAPSATTGLLAFANNSATYSAQVTSGTTTISANINTLATAPASAGTGNIIAMTGSGTLVLSGSNYLFGDPIGGPAGNAGFTVDGGGTLAITGYFKAASTLSNNKGNFTNTVGQNSSNNVLTISGSAQVLAGGLTIGGGTNGGNTVTISSPGSLANPSYQMIGNGQQLNLGGGQIGGGPSASGASSNNSLIVSNGGYVSQTNGGGTNGWGIGLNTGANYNSILITGSGSTIDRSAVGASYIYVGYSGSNNSLTVSNSGTLLEPRRLAIGDGPGGQNNSLVVTGAGSTISWATAGGGTDNQSALIVGGGSLATGNSLLVTNGASAIIGNRADLTSKDIAFSIGMVDGADNNYIRVTGAGSALTLAHYLPVAIGGSYVYVSNSASLTDSIANGNHLDVQSGAALNMNDALYLMGVNSAFNLGDGNAVSTAAIGTLPGNAPFTPDGVYLRSASSQLNFDNGVLAANGGGQLVSGPGQINFNGPAFILTNQGGGNSIDSVIAGTGSLTKQGSGTLSLSNTNTFSGNTRIDSGTLTLTATAGSTNWSLQDSTLDTTDAGTFSFGFMTSVRLGGLIGNGASVLALNNASSPTPQPVALSVGYNNANTNYNGLISGGGSLTKTGTGTLAFSGTNTYSGGTTITAGVLELLNDSPALALGSGALTMTGGTLDLHGVEPAVTSLSGTGVIGDGGTDPSSLTVTGGGSFSGTIQDKVGTGTQKVKLYVTGGTLVLSGSNSYSGGTAVSAGTLILQSSASIRDGSSLTVGNAAAFAPVVGDVTLPAAAGPAIAVVPEPGTMSLILAGGTAALVAASWRRRKRTRR